MVWYGTVWQDFFPWAPTQPFPQTLLALRINQIEKEHPEHALKIVDALYVKHNVA